MMKSNIQIAPNIYIRSSTDIRKDRPYTDRITGAKRLRRIQKTYVGGEAIPLSDVQRAIAENGLVCHYAKNGEMSFGPIRTPQGLQWVDRCEYTDCFQYPCTRGKRPIDRTPAKETQEDAAQLQRSLEALGVRIEDDAAIFERDRDTAIIEEEARAAKLPTEPSAEERAQFLERFVPLSSPARLLDAPLDSCILFDAQAWTGKTHLLIQRLLRLLQQAVCPADGIYHLCTTPAAVKTVEAHLEAAIADGTLPPTARAVHVMTLDAFALHLLHAMQGKDIPANDGDSPDRMTVLTRAEQLLSAEALQGVRYLILDGIQDLVGVRARIVLTMLRHLHCGVLLAGDRIQAICDPEDDDPSLDSTGFYRALEKALPPTTERYTLIASKQQSDALAKEAAQMRAVAYRGTALEQNRYAKRMIARHASTIRIASYIRQMRLPPSEPTAILCRGNGEAAYVSSLLCQRKIAHTFERGCLYPAPLPRWIADVLWDQCGRSIGRDSFLARFKQRCHTTLSAQMVWSQLCRMTQAQDDRTLDLVHLREQLQCKDAVERLPREAPPTVTVSTVYKARGRAFSRVILVRAPFQSSTVSAEEARIRYVALTRAKELFLTMQTSRRFFQQVAPGRVIETASHHLYRSNERYCKRVAIGLTEDVEAASFVEGDLGTVLERQGYIAQHVQVYDPVDVIRTRADTYEVYHQGHLLGKLSQAAADSLAMAETQERGRPARYKGLYIGAVTTAIIPAAAPDVPQMFQGSRLCYGFTVTGLAKPAAPDLAPPDASP